MPRNLRNSIRRDRECPWTSALAAAAALVVATGVRADLGPLDDKQDEAYESQQFEETFKESAPVFPPFPRKGDLVLLDTESLGNRYSYFLDRRSVQLGTDEVIRYTIVIRSPTGAANVYFEGIRCETKEVKSYGYATARGTFTPLSGTGWKDLYSVGPFAYRNVLADEYLCDKQGWPRSEKAIAAAFRTHTAGGVRIQGKDPEEASSGK